MFVNYICPGPVCVLRYVEEYLFSIGNLFCFLDHNMATSWPESRAVAVAGGYGRPYPRRDTKLLARTFDLLVSEGQVTAASCSQRPQFVSLSPLHSHVMREA